MAKGSPDDIDFDSLASRLGDTHKQDQMGAAAKEVAAVVASLYNGLVEQGLPEDFARQVAAEALTTMMQAAAEAQFKGRK